MRRFCVLVIAAGLLLAAAPPLSPAIAASSGILVYDGNGPLDEGYTQFGAAVGEPVDTLTSLPASLEGYSCVLLPGSGYGSGGAAFSDSDKAALASYVMGGGSLIALGEWAPEFDPVISTLNDLASSLGASVSIVADDIDNDFHVTTDIIPSAYTVGVGSLAYAATSQVSVSVSGDAVGLARTVTGASTFIAADPMGAGLFVLSGDTNIFSDGGGQPGYANNDNGRLAANLCGGVAPATQLSVDASASGHFVSASGWSPSASIPLQVRVQAGSETVAGATVGLETPYLRSSLSIGSTRSDGSLSYAIPLSRLDPGNYRADVSATAGTRSGSTNIDLVTIQLLRHREASGSLVLLNKWAKDPVLLINGGPAGVKLFLQLAKLVLKGAAASQVPDYFVSDIYQIDGPGMTTCFAVRLSEVKGGQVVTQYTYFTEDSGAVDSLLGSVRA